jgi:anthranilate phosphoribosyltransferase
MLGPVVNPCFPKYQRLGVYNLEMARLYNYLLQNTGNEYVIVHSFDGYDEISLTGNYKMISRDKEQVIEPAVKLKKEDLFGGRSADEAARIFLDVLKGEGARAQNEVVIANAAMAIHCVKKMPLPACMEEARASLESRKALNVYNKLMIV